AALAGSRQGKVVVVPERSPAPGRLECGHWAVIRASELLGVPVEPRRVAMEMPVGPKGHSMLDLVQGLERQGLRATAWRKDLDAFLASAAGVYVVHLKSPDHFVVVSQASGERIGLFDGYGRHVHADVRALRQRWTGNVLEVTRPATPDTLESSSPDRPRARFETLFVDRGDIPIDGHAQSIDYPFRLHNVGTAPLTIDQVHVDCQCLSALKPDAPIAPGAGGVIVLRYVVGGERKPFIHEAVVETNDPEMRHVVLRAAGTTDTLVTCAPSMVHFGVVPPGVTARRIVVVRYRGEKRLELSAAQTTSADLRCAVRQELDPGLAAELWPHSHGRLRLTGQSWFVELAWTAPEDPNLLLESTVEVATNIPGFELLKVPVRGQVAALVTAGPSVLCFQGTENQPELTQSVGLRSPAGKPVRVLGVTMAGEESNTWRWSAPVEPRSEAELRLVVPAAVAQRWHQRSLAVRLEVDGQPALLTLPVYYFNSETHAIAPGDPTP
ncbi:MAG TPA: DUF1573 domain-containing protein, partial [Gemmatales bacterium]|nr:DUF1573 domain-containing protein [Gemmatales bacterium]